MKRYNRYIDHTLLKADATKEDIKKLCEEALEYDLFSVCVNSSYVSYASKLLKGSDVSVAAVIGFPLGAMSTESKVFEAEDAVKKGASEIDMVINVGMLRSGEYDYVREEIKKVTDAAIKKDAIVKVILETCLLTNDEIVTACRLAVDAGAQFVKTSTGFSIGGARIEDIILMRKTVGDKAKIKASGGIRTFETMKKMIDAGADRIGASASVSIMKEIKD